MLSYMSVCQRTEHVRFWKGPKGRHLLVVGVPAAKAQIKSSNLNSISATRGELIDGCLQKRSGNRQSRPCIQEVSSQAEVRETLSHLFVMRPKLDTIFGSQMIRMAL